MVNIMKIASNLIFIITSSTSVAQTPYLFNNDGTHGNANDLNWNRSALVFTDDFSDETLTKSKWNYIWGWGQALNNEIFEVKGDISYDNITPPYNSSLNQPYNFTTAHNHIVNNGEHVLRLHKESPAVNLWWYSSQTPQVKIPHTYNYTAGFLISKDNFKYGFFEARLKINHGPGTVNTGVGQCFWLYADPLVNTDYSEIDVAENDPVLGQMTSNFHFTRKGTGIQYSGINGYDPCTFAFAPGAIAIHQNEYHTYSLE